MKKFVMLLAIIMIGFTACKQSKKEIIEQINEVNKPNFLFIITDDQHRNNFNFLPEGIDKDGKGLNLTPTIDKLASEGVILDGIHCPSPLCVPSRFNYFTGMYASRATNEWFQDLHKIHGHTFIHQEPKITSVTPTLAKHLKTLGYTTGFVGKNHSVEAHGWELLDEHGNVNDPVIKSKIKKNDELARKALEHVGFDYVSRVYHTNPAVVGPKSISVHNMEWITEGALKFIEDNAEKPFFLMYSVTVPHGPKNGWKMNPNATPVGILENRPTIGTDRKSIGERLKANNLDDSKGDLIWLDDNIEVLLNKLKEKGVLDNTVIVYVSDHGVESGKTTVYEGGMKTIAFMWASKLFKNGTRNSTLTSTVDFGATIVSLAGGNVADFPLDGVDLTPLLKGEKQQVHETIYGEMGHTRAVIKGNYKYIALRYSDYTANMSVSEREAWLKAANVYMTKTGEDQFTDNDINGQFGHSGFIPDGWWHEKIPMENYPAFFEPDQLYDLSEDPYEQNNLANKSEYKEVLAEMKEALKVHLKDLPGDFAEFKQGTTQKTPKDSIMYLAAKLRKVVFH